MGGARTFCLGQEPRPARCPQATQLRLHPDRPVPVAGSLRTEAGEAGEAGGSGGRELTSRARRRRVAWTVGGGGELLGGSASCKGRCPHGGTGRDAASPPAPAETRVGPGVCLCRGPARPITCVPSFHSKDAKGRRLLPVPNTATQRHVPGGSLGTLGSSQHGAPVSPLSPPPQVLAVGGGSGAWGVGRGGGVANWKFWLAGALPLAASI